MYDDITIFWWTLWIYLRIMVFTKHFNLAITHFNLSWLNMMRVLLVLSCYFIYVLKPVNAFLWRMIMYDDITIFGCNVVILPWYNDICDKCWFSSNICILKIVNDFFMENCYIWGYFYIFLWMLSIALKFVYKY